MGFLIAMAVIAAVVGACWRLRENSRRQALRPAGPERRLHLPRPDPLLESQSVEKSVTGQLWFLHDLKRRERETEAESGRKRADVRPATNVIDAQFREVIDRDSQV